MLFSTSLEPIVESVRSHFGISKSYKIFLSHSPAHAVTEAVKGLALLFPHRTAVILRKDTSPLIEEFAQGVSRDSLQPVLVSGDDLSKSGKSTLLYLVSDDDPLTGEIFYKAQAESVLADQKIYSIRLSTSFLLNPFAIGNYTIWIHQVSPQLTVSVLGDRVNYERLHYRTEVLGESWLPATSSENSISVLDFESALQSIAEAPLFSKTSRIFDRAVLAFSDIDGSALRELLIRDVKGLSGDEIETSSLCRWGRLKGTEWLSYQGYRPEQIRGLVAFSVKNLKSIKPESVIEAYRKIKKLQGM